MEVPVGYIIAAFVGSGSIIAFLYRALIVSKDKEVQILLERISELESVKRTYQEIAADALKSSVETTNFYRAKEGKPPLILPAQVVAEGSSPPTQKQRDAALAATYRAAMVIIRDVTGQEPRKEPGHSNE